MVHVPNGIKQHESGAFVLDGVTPEDVALSVIEGGQKEPFYIFNMDEAYRRIQHFKEVMPRVQIFYAMKANDWELLLKLVVSQQAGFDCASLGEICKILNLGVSPLGIIYALPKKSAAEMIFARNAGIKHTTFDSSEDLHMLNQYWPEAKLLIRIRVDGESVYKLGIKFGCDFNEDAINLLEEAATLGLSVIGVAFHVGSGCSSDDSYVLGLQRARALFDHEKAAGRTMKIVDIGGGFLSARTDSIDPVAKLINKALEDYFPDSNIQIVAEPGRYLNDSSATLYNNINSTRRIYKDNKPLNWLYLNDGVHGTMRYTEYWHTVEVLKRGSMIEDAVLEETILWGPTGDSEDRVMAQHTVRLPRCTVDDWLVFKTQGAYTFGFQGSFSSLEKIKMRPVISKGLWKQIKESEVFTSLDFILNPDISQPLSNSIQVVLQKNTNNLKTCILSCEKN